MNTPIVTLKDLPYCIGSFKTPRNPEGLPDTFPISIGVDAELLAIRQFNSEKLSKLLEISYRLGAEMGTPVSDSELGLGYATDFLHTIKNHVSRKGRALEIGAGVGYISHQLKLQGWEVDSIEPGQGYEKHWERYDLNVINDFFPTDHAKGPYDLIVSYAVLEHIAEPVKFLEDVAAHLAPEGTIMLAVPDCTEELRSGDPGMLIHEHYYYYTVQSLQRCLNKASLVSSIFPAGYGRLLYAVAKVSSTTDIAIDDQEKDALEMYPSRCEAFIQAARSRIQVAIEECTVGIYCPARALAILPQTPGMRFFDDSTSLHGKYYPPFDVPIESRQSLLNNPPEVLWIMSRTFGKRLREVLAPQLPQTSIFLIEEINI